MLNLKKYEILFIQNSIDLSKHTSKIPWHSSKNKYSCEQLNFMPKNNNKNYSE